MKPQVLLSRERILFATRMFFAAYFAVILIPPLFSVHIPYIAEIPVVWGWYLLAIYLACEKIYSMFYKRGVDLSFAFPILLSIFLLNGVSVIVRGQEHMPIINRAEHLTSFVLLAYIVWIFFLKYLPHKVWQDHPYYTAILTLSITSLAGVGNEIFELALDTIFGTTTVGPNFDTSVDLLMNTLGSGLFLAVQLILREGGINIRQE